MALTPSFIVFLIAIVYWLVLVFRRDGKRAPEALDVIVLLLAAVYLVLYLK